MAFPVILCVLSPWTEERNEPLIFGHGSQIIRLQSSLSLLQTKKCGRAMKYLKALRFGSYSSHCLTHKLNMSLILSYSFSVGYVLFPPNHVK